MPELNVMESPKIAGFVDSSHSNANKRRMEKEEEELAALLESTTPKEAEAVVAAPTSEAVAPAAEAVEEDLSKSEQTYKKRYDDIRRHQNQLMEKVKELETQLVDASSMTPPTTEAELQQWTDKYPDVANIVSTLAKKQAEALFANANDRLSRLDEITEAAERAKAESEIRAIHPDFDELKNGDEFHDWADKQPKWVRDALYENSDDPASVTRVIDLYKVDNNITNKQVRVSDKKAAQAVITKKGRTSVDADEASRTISESDVNKMSAAEYEKRSDEIMEAVRGGRFVYDMSGGAR